MDKNTAAKTVVGEGAGRRARVACAECKAKKKRCTHQEGGVNQDVSRRLERREESEENSSVVSPEDTQAPVPRRRGRPPRREKNLAAASPPAADNTKVVHGPKKGMPTQRKSTKSTTSAAAASPSGSAPAPAPASAAALAAAAEDITHPEDNLGGSMVLGIHTVMARELKKKMADAQAKWQIAQEAIDEGKAATAAVQATLDQWLEAWKRGL